ncbi:MAG: f1pep1 2 [Phycisphaerales bacterium]|nr:f1pep1 2 [Phycisphaerales bacterium]
MTLRKWSGLALALLVCAAAAGAAEGPPVAEVRAVTDDYHGRKITDPYRYFENLTDPAVRGWIDTQAKYAAGVLAKIRGRDQLLKRITELDAGAPYRISVIRRWPNGDLHYLKRMAAENLDKLYFRDGKSGTERLLVDPERYASVGGGHASLSFCRPSNDGKYVAYGIAAAGSEQTVLHVLDVAAGKDLAETIDRMESDYTAPCWLPDNGGFVYSRRRLLAADAPATEVYKRSRAFLHRLGTDPEKDSVVFEMGSDVPMAETDFPSVVITAGSRWAVGKIKHGDETDLTLYAAPVESLARPARPWRKVCGMEQEVTEFAVHGEEIYLVTAAGAPRYRVVRTSLERPDFAKAETVVAAGPAVVEWIGAGRDALYVSSLDGGLNKVAQIAFAGGTAAAIEQIQPPAGAASAFLVDANPDTDGALIASASWTRGGGLYAFDPATKSLTDTGLRPRGKFDDVEGYEAEEVQVTSHDGERVPLSILHKKGIALDGSHPTLVNGYGAYGMGMPPHFNPINLAWLERGGVLAYAHVRGGGEFGKEWHRAGQKATKPNTWKDFIACCEYLVAKGYTSPAKLAGEGGSAGGILIGRAVTERPDLFAAAVMKVGCLDLLRMETTTNGVPNIPEFGTVKTREGFDGLLAMSAYHHVVDQTKYPAVLLTHGINDPRVEPWMSAKMTARLQAATASGKPVLFRVDYDAGHGIGSTKEQHHQQLADEWAFLLWQMGESGFSN